jgi:hypothetical protein
MEEENMKQVATQSIYAKQLEKFRADKLQLKDKK